MKKAFVFLIAFLPALDLFSQAGNKSELVKQKIRFNENNIYLFCRGTTGKSNLIAHKFNICDTNITHVGIGFLESGKVRIYNVSDVSDKSQSALVIDSIESFLGSPDVYYFSFWEYDNNTDELELLKKTCYLFAAKKIYFDASFTIAGNDTLYCSEFCATVLKSINLKKFDYRPSTMVLNNVLYESILDRKMLEYYPVDFFQRKPYFKKIFECRF